MEHTQKNHSILEESSEQFFFSLNLSGLLKMIGKLSYSRIIGCKNSVKVVNSYWPVLVSFSLSL